jgi:hypothetical protein
VKYPLAAATLAALFVGAALAAGQYRFAAMLGAAIASFTGLAAMLGIRLTAHAARPVQAALVVVAVGFLVRLVLLALGTVAVVKASASVVAFVVAFFVPFFVFAALEAAYVHSLRSAASA